MGKYVPRDIFGFQWTVPKGLDFSGWREDDHNDDDDGEEKQAGKKRSTSQ